MSKNKQKLELTWIGKDDEYKDIEPRILVEVPEKSYGDKNTENMLIHGDNLLALKALEQDFTGKIKCIYIDPPYNTGSAFEHYDDNVEHSKWLSLMKSRLEILKTLLANDGVIFVQIDNNEHAYLKILMDEIFGRNNFITDIVWRKKSGGGQTSEHFAIEHEYIFVYKKNNWQIIDEKEDYKIEEFSKTINNKPAKIMKLEKWGNSAYREDRPSLYYSIKNPDGIDFFPKAPDGKEGRWRKKPESLDDKHIYWEKRNNEWKPYEVIYFDEVTQRVLKTRTIWLEYGNNTEAANEMKQLFKIKDFATPKPEKLIEKILNISTREGDLVLDSFLGSGTTAAVAHKMGRKWIGIELGNHCYTHCEPRLHQVVDGTDQGGISKVVNWQGGGGYKFYELAPSLLKKDEFDNWIIEPKYDAEMLAEAMAKHEGYKFSPDENNVYKQGYSTEKDFIFTTTQFLSVELLNNIHNKLEKDESLLICATHFEEGVGSQFDNITVKKIPQILLNRCEFGRLEYNLNIIEEAKPEDFEEDEIIEDEK